MKKVLSNSGGGRKEDGGRESSLMLVVLAKVNILGALINDYHVLF